MNTANLQLEGVLLALAALTDLLKRKGLVSREEVASALAQAEQAAVEDHRRPPDLSVANHEAMVFPIRLLKLANAREDGEPQTFSALATAVGQSKPAR
ncbi:hypothetical protein [Chelatococcus reniformis]|uniref:Uncharacterized protein n=1 Tax=Chelatococcus reniformis TaxID=1494448 RepID=A0A916XNE8_9HYPH|nr:hypothetical protein [Chelatococcus reniformis]GGC89592.1 hypothetical protein GCM10010994_54290 [Chelatococcus reniformis]